MKITVIGTVFTDIKGHPFEKFIPEGRNAGSIEFVHGGVARNIAEDLAVLGAEPAFVSLVEPGGAGDDILSHLNQCGVRTEYVERARSGSGTWLAIFNEKGDVVSSISVRADLKPLAPVLEKNMEAIFADTDMILLEIDIDTEAVEKVFEAAKRYQKKVCCAVATMSHALDKKEYLKHAGLFICNIQEAGMIFEMDLLEKTPKEMCALMPDLLEKSGLNSLIVTMGKDGSVYASRNGECGICPAKNVTMVDSTGAGDSYCAGAVLALTKGCSLQEACTLGTECAAAVVSSPENVLRTEDLTHHNTITEQL